MSDIIHVIVRLTGNAHILICGRSKANAEKIIASLPQTPESKYEFIECDVSLMKNVAVTASSIKSQLGSLNYLVVSQGMITTQGFTPTAEGIDAKLALHFYSRWKVRLGPTIPHSQESPPLTVSHLSWLCSLLTS